MAVIVQQISSYLSIMFNFLEDVAVCDSFDWNGVVTKSGTYTFETTNSLGCDSTATLVSNKQPLRRHNYLHMMWNGDHIESGTYTFHNSVG